MSRRQEQGIIFTGRETAELQPIEVDDTPLGPHEVAGHTVASLVSVGTEVAILTSGVYPQAPGYAAVFTVEDTGADVEGCKIGDLAFLLGPHQSYQRCEKQLALPVPRGLSAQEAPFARILGVVMSTLTTTAARPPAKVLVTGLGIVGHLAARLFDLCGYQVMACDPVADRRETAAAAGLRRVEATVPLTDADWAGRVDLVLECSGHEQAVLDGCNMVAKGGEVVLIGVPWRKQTEVSAHALLWAVFHKYAVLRSGWEWEVPLHATPFRRNSLYGNMAAALRWLAEGRLSVEGLGTVVSPGDATDVYKRLAGRRFDTLTAIFDWTRL